MAHRDSGARKVVDESPRAGVVDRERAADNGTSDASHTGPGTGEPASGRVISRGPAFGARVSIHRTTTGAGHCPEVDMSEARSEHAQPEPMDETWPYGLPYTIYFPDGDGTSAADLEYPAHLPRVGDIVEYIDETGVDHRYRVREIVHTLQSSDSHRPAVAEAAASPQSVARLEDDAVPELPGSSGQVRAGLPKVFLEPAERA
jgi:hypothetical protein